MTSESQDRSASGDSTSLATSRPSTNPALADGVSHPSAVDLFTMDEL
jgi:hypothetical protein